MTEWWISLLGILNEVPINNETIKVYTYSLSTFFLCSVLNMIRVFLLFFFTFNLALKLCVLTSILLHIYLSISFIFCKIFQSKINACKIKLTFWMMEADSSLIQSWRNAKSDSHYAYEKDQLNPYSGTQCWFVNFLCCNSYSRLL